VEVLEEFVDYAECGDVTDWTLYSPPYRDRLPDGTLGPEFGPRTRGAMAREMKRWRERWTWDEETARMNNPSLAARDTTHLAARYDAHKVARYVATHSHEIPMRELEAFVRFYREGLSYGAIAREWGTVRKTVENTLQSLRARVRGRK